MTIEQTIAQAVFDQLRPIMDRQAQEIASLRESLGILHRRPLSLGETADRLKKSVRTVTKYIRDGSLPAVQRNGIYYIQPGDVDDFLRSPRQAS
jgi:hypothetical protein